MGLLCGKEKMINYVRRSKMAKYALRLLTYPSTIVILDFFFFFFVGEEFVIVWVIIN